MQEGLVSISGKGPRAPEPVNPFPSSLPSPTHNGSRSWAIPTKAQARTVGTCHQGQVVPGLAHTCVRGHTHTHAQGQSSLGRCHLRSPESHRNNEQARVWQRRAAARGSLGLGPHNRVPSGDEDLLAEPGGVGAAVGCGRAQLVHGSDSGEPDFTPG